MYRNMRCRQWCTWLTKDGNNQLLQLHGTLSMLTRDSPGSFRTIRSEMLTRSTASAYRSSSGHQQAAEVYPYLLNPSRFIRNATEPSSKEAPRGNTEGEDTQHALSARPMCLCREQREHAHNTVSQDACR